MMSLDLIDRSQRLVLRGGKALRGSVALPPDGPPRRSEAGSARDQHFVRGDQQIQEIAEEVTAQTGRTFESCHAVDFGCGFGRMAIPLAQRCEHVYGLDVSLEDLRAADQNAKQMNVENVEWLPADKLADLRGSYDLALSHWVFPHIPSRQAERTFATLVHGLRPGGIGVVHVGVRPSRPLSRLLRRRDPSYAYLLMNSLSLNRLGEILSEARVNRWVVRWHKDKGRDPDSATLLFEKPGD